MKINLGQGIFTIKKSPNLIGVKLRPNAKKLPSEIQKGKLFARGLGGFVIYKPSLGNRKIDAILDKVRKARNVVLGTHVYYIEGSKNLIVPTGKIMVVFASQTKIKDRKKILDSLDLKVNRRFLKTKYVVEVTKKSPNPLRCCTKLMKEEAIISAMPDWDAPQTLHEDILPGDDLLPYQWHLRNQGAAPGEPASKILPDADLKIMDAWDRLGNKGSNQITVAVIDQSFQVDHPSYKAQVVSTHSIYTDPFAPIGSGHGTSCASLISASDNGEGITGVAPGCNLILIEGSTFSWDVLEEIFKFCKRKKVDVISCSWGSIEHHDALSPMHQEVIRNITSTGRNGLGIPILFSAGNENEERINHFGRLPEVIAVAGSTSADEHFDQSNRGPEITVTAPAGNFPILTARANFKTGVEKNFFRDGQLRGPVGEYQHFEGTSASCPLVAGVCALILSANPNLRASEVREILSLTADKIGSPQEYVEGHSLRFGYGRVNADRAVAEALRRADGGTMIEPETVGEGNGLFQFDVKPQSKRGFGVQMGVYAEYGNVLIQTNRLRKKYKHKTLVNINELNGKTVYKLILGPFSSKNAAKKMLKSVKNSGDNGFIVNLGLNL